MPVQRNRFDELLDERERQEAERARRLRRSGADRLLRYAGVMAEHRGARVTDFELIEHEPAVLAAWAIVAGSAPGMLLKGAVGVGKTHLAAAIVREARIERGLEAVQFILARQLFHELWQAMGDGRERQVLRAFCGHRLLVLDDVGAEKPSDAVRAAFHELLSRRNGERRATVVTTNLALEEIAEVYGPPIASRMKGWEQVTLRGDDRRAR